MARKIKILKLWRETLCAELQKLLGTPVAVRSTKEISPAVGAYRSLLLVEGPVHGAMYVTISSVGMVELAQMAAGEPVDSHAAWTHKTLDTWKSLLNAAGTRLAAQLTEEFSSSSQSRCTVSLAETNAVDGKHPASEAETVASGAAVQQWLLRAGNIEISLFCSAQVEITGEQSQVPATQPTSTTGYVPTQASPETGAAEEIGKGAFDPGLDPGLAPASSTSPPENIVTRNRTHESDGENAQKFSGADSATPAAESQQESSHATQPKDLRNAHESRQRLDLLLDIELEATLRFGALELPLREVLELGPGDVLPLDRHVREPVDLVVGDRIVARGEVVLVGGNFGLQVTEVAEPRKRLETIRCLF